MTASSTVTSTYSYSASDIENVTRKLSTDLIMIASSTGAITEEKAREYGHDIELLAKNGYLKAVDVTLSSLGVEHRAVRYDVNTESGELASSRPGGVLWPKVSYPDLRIVLIYTPEYTSEARSTMSKKLNINWVPTIEDISHSSLKSNTGRNYVSNAYGMQRKDFTK